MIADLVVDLDVFCHLLARIEANPSNKSLLDNHKSSTIH
jgi:hypothetical protein